jgi:hypothetical protein
MFYTVYKTTNLINGKIYVGLHITNNLEDDYLGSGSQLKSAVKKYGKENFKREIIHLCKSKGECGYLEAKEQFVRGVMETDDYYNNWIMVRVRKSHIKDYNARLLKTNETREL